MNLAAAGAGIAVVSRLIVGSEARTGWHGIIPWKNLTIHRPLHLQRIRGRSPSPTIASFLEVLKTRIARQADRLG